MYLVGHQGVVVCVLDFMKIILVQLAHEAGEIGVLEDPGQYRRSEFIQVLQNC
jgi:hypothetical protein